MQLHVGTLNAETWEAFSVFFTERKQPVPRIPTKAVLAIDDEGVLVAGVCRYDTDGPYMFLEHLSYDPELSSRDGHSAVRFLSRVVQAIGSAEGKIPLVLTGQKGIGKALLSQGYQQSPTAVFYTAVGVPPQKTRAPADQNEDPLTTDEDSVPQGTPPRKRRRRQVQEGRRPGNRVPRASRQAEPEEHEAPLDDFEDGDWE